LPNIFAVERFLSTRNGLKADNIHAGAEPATNPANKAYTSDQAITAGCNETTKE
jgi:hypothetical protein